MKGRNTEIESQLRTLEPIAPSAMLEARIAYELGSHADTDPETAAIEERLHDLVPYSPSEFMRARLSNHFDALPLPAGKPRLNRYSAVLAAAAGLLLAIGLLTLWLGYRRAQGTAATLADTAAQPGSVKAIVGEPVRMEHNEDHRFFDDGIVMLQNRHPARQLRHRYVQRVQWYDPDKDVLVETVSPKEDVTIVRLCTY